MPGIHAAAKAAGISDEQAQSFCANVLAQVNEGETIVVRNFGTFKAVTRSARTITSPQIPGGKAEVPERRVLKFTAAPATKQLLNGGEVQETPAEEPEVAEPEVQEEQAEEPAEEPEAKPAKAQAKAPPKAPAKKPGK